jgi:hypothetical protein
VKRLHLRSGQHPPTPVQRAFGSPRANPKQSGPPLPAETLPAAGLERYLVDKRGTVHVTKSAVGPPWAAWCASEMYARADDLGLTRDPGAVLCQGCIVARTRTADWTASPIGPRRSEEAC